MKRLMSWRLPAFLILAATFAAASASAADTALKDTARFLAGMSVSEGSPLEPLTKESAFVRHSEAFDRAWMRLDTTQLSKVRSWAANNIKETQPTLFYMFSGPDFLYANVFFPKATTYVMAGLEVPGEAPDIAMLPKPIVARELDELRGSLNSVFSYSFFRTIEMRQRLYGRRWTGTVPVLLAFLARSGKTVESVSAVAVDKDGELRAVDAADKPQGKSETAASAGVKITFTGEGDQKQTLYYFATDLSNQGTEHSGFLKFCEKLGAGDSLIKSASYLPHSDGFSHIRDFLLKNSAMIVQDDTGIPFRHYDMAKWEVLPFGNYVRPIPLFRGNYQADMHSFFAKQRSQRLHFSFGYQWRVGDSAVLLATRKPAEQKEQQPADAAPGKLQPAAFR
jgi:hypothetical protein